ncbi:MAG: adenylate kinase [Verrucomicrobiales bacterium]
MQRIVLMGPPASGKGTQAARLSDHFDLESVSTGAVLREQIAQGTDLGQTAESHLDRGELLPDELMNDLVASWIKDNGARFIFDGYPRTEPQAVALAELLKQESLGLDCVIGLKVPKLVLRERATARLSCTKCNHVFQIDEDDGVTPGAACPDCDGGTLYRRDDDNSETFELRLEEYARKTQAVEDYYARLGQLLAIDGDGTTDEVFSRILKQLSQCATNNE